MTSIDERIVAMSFENTRFEANIATTMATLGKLDKTIAQIGKTNGLASIETSASKITLAGPMSALDKLRARLGRTNAGTTFTDIEKASDKVTLSGAATATDKLQSKINHISTGTVFSDMEKDSSRVNFSSLTSAIDGIGSHMSTMSIAVGTALGNVATKIATKGAQMVKSLALGPVIDGFHNYETQINAVQTILANTGLKGKSGLDQVKGALNDLNKYANLTVYNFSEMAKNIGTFTAAGVKLGPATSAIKGIANLAALSGSNSEQASTAMYQLSQAISAGKVGLQDWNSVVNAGMGGAVFQKALMNTAQAMGTVKKGAVEIDKATGKATINGKSFRESITAKPGEKSWLTSDVLTKTLSQFTGDMTNAQLAADGFNASQIKAIQSQAKTAVNAATQIKTFTQLSQAVKEEVGSAWAGVFTTLFGDINKATTLFSGIHTVVENMLTGPVNNFNKVLQEWAKLGGRSDLIDGLKTAFKDLQAILKPIKDAFREIFPPATARSLLDLTVKFRDLMKHLQASPETVNNIRRTFAGLFSILHIGWDIIKTVAGAIGNLLGASKKGAGGILDFTAKVGDFLKKLNDTAGRVGVFKALFGGLVEDLKHPLDLLKKLGDAIRNLFSGAATAGAGKFSGSMDILHKALGPIGGILDGASNAWQGFLKILDKVKTAISPLLENIAGVFNKFGDILSQGIKTADYSKVFSAVNTVLIAGIFIAIKKALGEGVHVDFGGGVIKNLSETLKSLTGNLEKMQTAIHAATLLAIAGAIAVLAVGIAALSQINPKKLTSALTAVAVGIGELVGAMAILSKVGGTGAAALSILLIASAMTILAIAVKLFATMSWDQLARGLTGVAGALVAVNAGTQFMNGPKLLVTAAALLPLAVGLNILGLAVKIFATMSWEGIAKGLIGITGALTGIGLAMQLMPATLPLTGAGLILVSTGLIILSGAVLAFGHMKLETIAKGVMAIAASLTVIALAMSLMPPTLIIQAAGLMLVAVAMTALTAAIGILGHMNVLTLVKGIVAMGGALVVLGLGLDAMAGALPGAAGLLLAAFALGVLVPVLGALGLMSWGVILKGLAAIAGTLTVLAVIGGLAAVPLIALGAAILVLGVGLAAVGAAVYLFAKGISLVGDNSGKAVAAIVAASTAFVIAFPKMIIDFVKGLVTILGSVVELAPKIVSALVSIAVLLLDGITKLAPKIATTIGALIVSIITVLNNHAGQVIDAGFKLLVNLLSGIAKNIGQVTDKAVEVVTNFLRALGRNAPKLVASGVAALTSFLRGITNHIPNIVKVVANLITTFVSSVARNIPRVIDSAGNLIASFLKSLARQVPKIISAGTNIILGFIRGVGNASTRIINTAVDTATKFINALARALVRLVNVGFNAVINFLNGIADAIRKHNDALYNAGWNVASAILSGLLGGLSKLAGKVISKIGDIASSIPHKFLDILQMASPSKVMADIGKNVMLGLHNGLLKHAKGPIEQSIAVASAIIDQFKNTLGISSPSKVMEEIGKAVNQGFAKGLLGSQSDIKTAFSTLNSKLTDAIINAKDKIASEQAKLDSQLKKKHPNLEIIAAARKVIKDNEDVLNRTSAAQDALTHRLSTQRTVLISLSRQYDQISAKLQKASQVLDEARRKRDESEASLTTQFSTTPQIDQNSTTMVTDYTKALQDQIAATASYADTLKQLRALGLDDKTYQKLLDEGLAGKKFAEQLLAGGKAGVDTIDALDAQIQGAAKSLAHTAATQLYQAGVSAAKGIVDGLVTQKNSLHNAMVDLADVLVTSLKRKLKIRSPSEVFAEIGRLSIQGMTTAMDNSAKGVENSAARVGERAVLAIRKSMSGMSSAIGDIEDINPVITPVLDLSNVRQSASQLGDILKVPLVAATSTDQASAIFDQTQAAAAVSAVPVPATQAIKFEQNNYSPDPLSNIEIYRQTNNQLSRLKSLVGVT